VLLEDFRIAEVAERLDGAVPAQIHHLEDGRATLAALLRKPARIECPTYSVGSSPTRVTRHWLVLVAAMPTRTGHKGSGLRNSPHVLGTSASNVLPPPPPAIWHRGRRPHRLLNIDAVLHDDAGRRAIGRQRRAIGTYVCSVGGTERLGPPRQRDWRLRVPNSEPSGLPGRKTAQLLMRPTVGACECPSIPLRIKYRDCVRRLWQVR
jgi:hypothetical protein